MQEIDKTIRGLVSDIYELELSPELNRPDEKFGDFATNIALRIAKQRGSNPKVIADELAAELKDLLGTKFADITIAGPGFINLKMSDEFILDQLKTVVDVPQTLSGKTIVVEYGDPNPFKTLHAGHLYTGVVGDSIANMLASAGGKVHRVNFGGDVGLHVGRTMWAIIKKLKGVHPEKLNDIDESERAAWMTECYVSGTSAYEDDETAKKEIVELNKHIYRLHSQNDHDTAFAQIYWTCRQWSYDYFDSFYNRIGVEFEKYYPESEVADLGLETVKANIKEGIFEESDGAIVFKGEAHGLHTRVFISSEGLPTYEAKDVGLIEHKYRDYKFDKSVVITGNEQAQYMAVVLKAIEQFQPELVAATSHLTHGLVKLQGGEKMSSRKGNILRAVDVLDAASEANKSSSGKDDQTVVLGAVKYAFLKSRLGGDIIYDPKESVSVEGNSGPYLQYAHARAQSILSKVGDGESGSLKTLEPGERQLANKLTEYTSIIERATTELMPHHICGYLFELAQTFNRFYETNKVVGNERQSGRAYLIAQYAAVLANGLGLLGINAPSEM